MPGIYDTFFSWIHGNYLIYNTCWEDPRLDREAMDIGPKSDVMVITSAGCNALDYALAGARSVHAVDVNPRQNALLELKIAAIRALSFEEFFQLFGLGVHYDFRTLYQRHLRPLLSSSAQSFWDRRPDMFESTPAVQGFYQRGTCGLVARTMGWYIRSIAHAQEEIQSLFACTGLEEQKRIYYSDVKPKIWKGLVKYISSSPLCMTLVGVPRAQRNLLVSSYPGGVGGFIEASIDAVFGELPLADNYFWRVYLFGEYTRECCPEYLTEKGFARLKEDLWSRINIYTSKVSAFLSQAQHSISHAVLLDHMDWLYAHDRDELGREWEGMLNRSNGSTRVIWRSAAPRLPNLESVRVGGQKNSRSLMELLTFYPERASLLHNRDRVHTYQSFHIADLEGACWA
jgi:S-adenosylmethionine-diacylglycerol 3-amino-3-carboxypropyl transferase